MKDFKFIDIDPNEIKFIKKNARFMSRQEFNSLVANIKRDGQLSSVPFCTMDDNVYTVISGNHRIKAAVEAGLSSVKIMYAENLSNDEVRALQLSHNSIVGQDDLVILKELYDEIDDAAMKMYSFIDNSQFDEIAQMNLEVVQPSNEYVSIALVFFDEELSKFEDTLVEVAIACKTTEVVIPMPMKAHEMFADVVSKIKEEHDIKDYGTTLIMMASLAAETLKSKIDSDAINS